jgi:hypothetical protein
VAWISSLSFPCQRGRSTIWQESRRTLISSSMETANGYNRLAENVSRKQTYQYRKIDVTDKMWWYVLIKTATAGGINAGMYLRCIPYKPRLQSASYCNTVGAENWIHPYPANIRYDRRPSVPLTRPDKTFRWQVDNWLLIVGMRVKDRLRHLIIVWSVLIIRPPTT